MKILTTLFFLIVIFTSNVIWGQTISYTTAGSSYTQNYDGLPNSGTYTYTDLGVRALSDPPISATGISGWYFAKNSGTGILDLFVVEAGAGTSGGLKDYGSASATDRALGGLGSGTYAPKFGALITNNTGVTLNKFTITYTGEQWRCGGNTTVQSIAFLYKVGATSINDASGFVSATSLNFASPIAVSTAGPLDGNAAANRTVGITATISGLTWANGDALAIRWDDANDTGNDHGLAIDDFSFSADVAIITNYYYSGTGNLHSVTNWGTNTNGTGTNPTNFTTDDQIFNIRNTSSVSTTAAWTVSGAGAKIVLGDASLAAITLTVTGGNAMAGNIDISAASTGSNTLILQDGNIPTFNSINPASTINYDGSVDQSISVSTYGNLTISNTGTKTFGGNTTTVLGNLLINNTTIAAPGSSPFATLNLGGDLTYQGTVTNPPDGNSITLITSGTGTQTITGNGNIARWFRLQTSNSGNNVILSTSGGTTNLTVGNSSGGGINLTTGSTLSLNGNTLTFFNGNVTVLGSGTISSSNTSNMVINRTATSGSFGYLRFTPGSETLNNLTINISGTGGDSVNMGSNLSVAGTLTFTGGKIRTGTNSVTLGSSATLTGEVAGNYVIGNLTTTRNVGTSSSTFGGIGVSLNSGTDNLGNVTILRVSGAAGIVTSNSNQSIARKWTITSDNPPTSGRDLTLTWLSSDDNGKTFSASNRAIAFRYSGSSWLGVGSLVDVSASDPRSLTVNTTSFSDWTVSDESTVKSLNLTNVVQEFYRTASNDWYPDVVTAQLLEITSPWTTVLDQANINLDANGQGVGYFFSVTDATNYYLVIKHRNSLETWSKNPVQFSSGSLTYDFTTAATQAYGDNLVLKGGKYCMWSGDINQDGSIDALDRSLAWNDRNLTGYQPSDVNGDGTVDALDRSICWNNRNIVKKWPGAPPLAKPIKTNEIDENQLRSNE